MSTRELALVYDTETTGLPDWHNPSDGPQQPHIVQLAAKLVDLESREEVQTIDLIVRPEGWEIPAEVAEIHGITTDYATEVGVQERLAVAVFMDLWTKASLRIGHSEGFDARILRIAIKRYATDTLADEWKAGAAVCTGRMSKGPMGMSGRRIPKLVDAYEHFFGEPHQHSHSALGDADACLRVYFAAKEAAGEAA